MTEQQWLDADIYRQVEWLCMREPQRGGTFRKVVASLVRLLTPHQRTHTRWTLRKFTLLLSAILPVLWESRACSGCLEILDHLIYLEDLEQRSKQFVTLLTFMQGVHEDGCRQPSFWLPLLIFLPDQGEMSQLWRAVIRSVVDGNERELQSKLQDCTSDAQRMQIREAYEAACAVKWGKAGRLLRDIAGNPFHHPDLNETWLKWNDGTVYKIAQAIYEEEAFDHMPILADALEDAGCDNAEILKHCRGEGPHVSGCWVVDLILAKDR